MDSLRRSDAIESADAGGADARPLPGERPAVSRAGGWHPVARTILAVAVVVALAYGALLAGNAFLRTGRVDTWAGPDATVRSGATLAGCPQVEGRDDGAFPAWVRFREAVYVSTGRVAPIGLGWQYGQTPYVEADYRLGGIRLLLNEPLTGSEVPDRVLLLQEPAQGARLYEHTDCT